MAFKDLINKGFKMIEKGGEMAKEAAKNKMDAKYKFNLLKTNSDHLTGLMPYKVNNQEPSIGKEQIILSSCLTVNVPIAKNINSLIPLDESIVDIKTSKGAKTEMEYWFIITDKKLWVANEREYKTYQFSEITTCEIVDKALMSTYVNFNDDAFVFDGTEGEITKFCQILSNDEIRKSATNLSTAYLCGIKPVKQFLNQYICGITIGEECLVLHNGKSNSKLVKIEDIETIQLLLDNTVVISKGRNVNQSMISASLDCHKMTIKVILKNENFLIDVLPQNVLGTIVKKEDSIYISNYSFAKNIIDTVVSLLK